MNEFLTDEDLFNRLSAGDKGAQLELYNRVFPVLNKRAYKIVKDKDMADDIAMTKFWDCLDAIKRIKDYNHLIARLVDATRNGSINHTKYKKTRNEKSLDPAELDLIFSAETNREIISNEVRIFVRNLVAKLSGTNQMVAQLVFIEGKTSEEIAKELKLSRSTVDNIRTREGAKIKKAFKKYWNWMFI